MWKRPIKELEWKILGEEIDVNTKEDLPEKEALNEELFEGDISAVNMVKDTYKNTKYIHFKDYKFTFFDFISYIMICGMFVAPILIMVLAREIPWFLYIICSVFSVIGVMVLCLLLHQSYYYVTDGFFFKTGSKPITFYQPRFNKNKGIIVYFSKDKIY